MKILNHLYRGVDKATDVLSFPQLEISNQQTAISNQHIVIGDIVINLQKAKRQAKKCNHSLQKEMDWLLIHGLLHLTGYEHEKSNVKKNKMEEKEKELFDLLYPSSRYRESGQSEKV